MRVMQRLRLDGALSDQALAEAVSRRAISHRRRHWMRWTFPVPVVTP